MKKFMTSLPARLLLAIIIGIVLGLVIPGEGWGLSVMQVAVTLKYIMSQLINFCVPLIIIGFIAPSITKLGNSATKMLGVAIIIAYTSSVLAAFMSMAAGYGIIPNLSIANTTEGLRDLPNVAFQLDIPQIMPVMSALVFSVLIGLAVLFGPRLAPPPRSCRSSRTSFWMLLRRSSFPSCPSSSPPPSWAWPGRAPSPSSCPCS